MTYEGAMEAARARHVDAGVLLSSPLVYASSKQIAELALAKRLPLISLFGEFPKNGGFMAYGPNSKRDGSKMRGIRRQDSARRQAK